MEEISGVTASHATAARTRVDIRGAKSHRHVYKRWQQDKAPSAETPTRMCALKNRTHGNRGLIVLGMHRSGTSTITGVLGLCGAWLGTDDQMTGSNRENAKGFFERRDLRSICDTLLFSADADWWHLADFNTISIPSKILREQRECFSKLIESLSTHGTWAIKEPRLCILLPAFQHLISNPIYIFPIRHPLEIAKSLRTRNNFSIVHGLALWELYTRRALFVSQGCDRIFVSYSEMVNDPVRATKKLVNALLDLGVTDVLFSEAILDFVTPELYHQTADDLEFKELAEPETYALWENLKNRENLRAEGLRPISKRTQLLQRDLEYLHSKRLNQNLNISTPQLELAKLETTFLDNKRELTIARAEAKRQVTMNRELHERALTYLSSELGALQDKLTTARQEPLKAFKRKLISKVLYTLSEKPSLFSQKRRASFRHSAEKRDPKHNEVRHIKLTVAKTLQPTQPIAPLLDESPNSRPLPTPHTGNSNRAFDRYPERSLAVVVPIYNAAEDVQKCIERLMKYSPPDVYFFLINDASTDLRIKNILARADSDSRANIIENSENLGFTKSINRGLKQTAPSDVIILNSDARVTPGWIDGIRRAAASGFRIATVTPMSDRAGAFSAPKLGNENPLPPGVDEITYARCFRRRGRGLYPSVPTGNGFCMFINRACLEEIGAFDEVAFPRGYGEENDFCMRAVRAGWKNLIDDRTYIFHDRAKSFGESKIQLLAAGRRIIDERYPEYKREIAVFSESPAILSARSEAQKAQLDCTAPNAANLRILFVISTVTGGTPQTNLDLMNALEASVSCFLFRCDSRKMQLWQHLNGEQSLLLEHELSEYVDPITHRSYEYDRVLSEWLTSLDLDIVHIRHPAWHGLSLPSIAREDGRAVVMSFHDYYTLCPTVTLLDEEHKFCGGICTPTSGDCKVQLWANGDIPALKNSWVHVWRRNFGEAFANCDAFVTTSPATRKRLLEHLPEVTEDRFEVIPHGRDFHSISSIRERPNAFEPLRILIPGNINEAKGLEIINALIAEDVEKKLEFHLLGKIRRGLSDDTRVIRYGPYTRDAFASMAVKARPHFGAVFSIWDETWCHTLTEMWSVGLPVIVFDFPTVAGRVRDVGAGWVLDHEDIPRLYRELLRIGHDPDEFARTQTALNAWRTGAARADNSRRMAADYFDLYRNALERRLGRCGVSQRSDKLLNNRANRLAVHRNRPFRVAVLAPSNQQQTRAPASTLIRLWERTRNSVDRDITYVRLNGEELLASLQTQDVDAAIIQRDALPAHLVEPIITAFSDTSTPWILDLDDNLLDVPPFKDPDRRYAAYAAKLRQLISAATLVTVSTQPLLATLAPLARRIELLPDRLSARLWRGPDIERTADDSVRALYMGSMKHSGDIDMVARAFSDTVKASPQFRLSVIGVANGKLPHWAERIEVPESAQSYDCFVPWLRKQAASIDFAIAPLEASNSNAFESPLKVLEFGALGLPVLASNHIVYRELGLTAPHVRLVGDGVENWRQALASQIGVGRQGGDELRSWILKKCILEPTLQDFDNLVFQTIKAKRYETQT